jgi:hypothetical protein
MANKTTKKPEAKAKPAAKPAKSATKPAPAARPRGPRALVVAHHESKQALAKSLAESLAREDEDTDIITARLSKASNQQLLRLQRVAETVKKQFGGRAKLIAAIGTAERKSTDKDYLAKLDQLSLPNLLQLATAAQRRALGLDFFGQHLELLLLRGVEFELAAHALDHARTEFCPVLLGIATPAVAVSATGQAAGDQRRAGDTEEGTFEPVFHESLPCMEIGSIRETRWCNRTAAKSFRGGFGVFRFIAARRRQAPAQRRAPQPRSHFAPSLRACWCRHAALPA